MLHGSHIMAGTALYLFISPIIGMQITAAGIIITAISSLIVDIDHPKSFISHWTAFTKMISTGISTITTHRGVTHTLYGLTAWIVIIATTLNYLGRAVWSPILLGAIIGYLSHLIIDSLNPQGVKWFGEESKIRIKGPIQTGGIIEKYGVPLIFAFIVVKYLQGL